mmetsp:Transcript_109862/g.316294  ORF Transcript_109862/g.316294 Transcript_109862/m.316294 type:complete len:206 (-) Transcript_109862:906-1523(-)
MVLEPWGEVHPAVQADCRLDPHVGRHRDIHVDHDHRQQLNGEAPRRLVESLTIGGSLDAPGVIRRGKRRELDRGDVMGRGPDEEVVVQQLEHRHPGAGRNGILGHRQAEAGHMLSQAAQGRPEAGEPRHRGQAGGLDEKGRRGPEGRLDDQAGAAKPESQGLPKASDVDGEHAAGAGDCEKRRPQAHDAGISQRGDRLVEVPAVV